MNYITKVPEPKFSWIISRHNHRREAITNPQWMYENFWVEIIHSVLDSIYKGHECVSQRYVRIWWMVAGCEESQRHDFNALQCFKEQKAGPFVISTESVSTILWKLNDSAVIFQAKICLRHKNSVLYCTHYIEDLCKKYKMKVNSSAILSFITKKLHNTNQLI